MTYYTSVKSQYIRKHNKNHTIHNFKIYSNKILNQQENDREENSMY